MIAGCIRRAGVVAAAVLAADQATKLATAAAPIHRGAAVVGLRNDRALLGIVGGGRLVLATAMVAVLLPYGWHVLRRAAEGRTPAWAAGLVLGGAAGNLLDRVALGSVRDFLVVGGVVVNLADLAVLVGLIAHTVASHRPLPALDHEGR